MHAISPLLPCERLPRRLSGCSVPTRPGPAAKGRRLLTSVYRVLREAESAMLRDIDDTRLQATLDMFDRIEQRLIEGDGKE